MVEAVRPRRGRPGVTLPELALAAWLFALVLLGLARFAGAQGRLAALTHDRARAADLVRTTALVLSGELRYTAPSDRSVGPDSVRLRAVRGVGVICRSEGSDLRIRYRGVRRPDPAKDSALVVSDSGTAGAAFAVTGVVGAEGTEGAEGAGCGDGYWLALDGSPPDRGLVLVFETGAYHLADGALRYRRGRGGRQPVTETILEAGTFEPRPAALGVRLRLHGDSLVRLPEPSAGLALGLVNPDAP